MLEIRKPKSSILSIENRNLFFFEAKGFSMWPFLKGNERLIVKKTPLSYLTPGDLILYSAGPHSGAGKQLICHRLIRKPEGKSRCLFYTRADASLGAERVTEEMFLGKVIGIIDNNKLISYDTIKYKLINKAALAIAPLIALAIKIYLVLFKKGK